MVKKGLIVVDMLNDFVHGALKTEEAASTVGPAAKVLEAFRKASLPVFFTNDSHLPTDFEMRLWGNHAMKGTWGAEVVEELHPRAGEVVLEKHAYSAFYGTPLDYLLRSLGVSEVVLIGLDADICVRHTAADAFFRGYAVAVIKDAVAARIDKRWEDYYRKVYGATIVNSDDITSYLAQ
ncbi:MAG: cysteine hydrolase family protein [Thermoprotei archaeon]